MMDVYANLYVEQPFHVNLVALEIYQDLGRT